MANPLSTSTSTASTALAHMLTKGSYLAPGLHGTTPSGTSAYFSVDLGLVHITALSTAKPTDQELDWLTKVPPAAVAAAAFSAASGCLIALSLSLSPSLSLS